MTNNFEPDDFDEYAVAGDPAPDRAIGAWLCILSALAVICLVIACIGALSK